jgi:hypothetical protein
VSHSVATAGPSSIRTHFRVDTLQYKSSPLFPHFLVHFPGRITLKCVWIFGDPHDTARANPFLVVTPRTRECVSLQSTDVSGKHIDQFAAIMVGKINIKVKYSYPSNRPWRPIGL